MEPRFEITFLADKGLFQEYGELHISKIRSSILCLVMGFVCLVCAGALFSNRSYLRSHWILRLFSSCLWACFL